MDTSIPAQKFDNPQAIAKEIYKQNLSLIKKHEQVRQIISNVSDGVIAMDHASIITFHNAQASLYAQKSSESLIGKTFDEVFDLFDKEDNKIQINSLLESSKKNFDKNQISIKGELRDYFVRIGISHFTAKSGAIEYVITITDLTDEHDTSLDLDDPETIAKEIYKRNLELHKERARIGNLLYRVSEGIIAMDSNANITLFNHTLEDFLNKKAKDVIGKNVDQVISLTDTKDNEVKLSAIITPIEQDAQPIPEVLILRGAFRNYYLRAQTSKTKVDRNYTEYLITLTDLTKEKQLEKAKDEFISITSHELKTPLTIVKSYLWMLSEGKGGELTPKQKQYLEKATKGAERMINLINDMLNVSRVEQGKIQFRFNTISLKEIAEDVVEGLKVKAEEKGLKISLKIDDQITNVYTDSGKLTEILINLGGNAIKYTEKGSIKIKAEPVNKSFVRISIVDTGRGIDKEEINKLFHKFQRLDSSYQTIAESGGTGLGLYIVKLYIGNMGGAVGVESEGLGKGSTFWVTIPTKKEQIDKGYNLIEES